MDLDVARQAIRDATFEPEHDAVARLLDRDERSKRLKRQVQTQARRLIEDCRAHRDERSLLDAFLDQFGLSSTEGVALMCLAESILRVPDVETIDALIADKLRGNRWGDHIGRSDSILVNASTWGLMLTGKVIDMGQDIQRDFGGWFNQLVNRMGEPIIRSSVQYAMQLLGGEFVFAATAEQALEQAAPGELYSFDMLGEAARTDADAQSYFDAYEHVLTLLAGSAPDVPIDRALGISVKLSALHPRFETLKRNSVLVELYPKLQRLAEIAARGGLQLTIDAEEANRLDLTLDLVARLAGEPSLAHWQGLGLALQAYNKRALPLLAWLRVLAEQTDRRLLVRLVKGAYWDTEIKRAQELGVATYPVFTVKAATDLAYLACAQTLLAHPGQFFPQFATHNANTLCNVVNLAHGKPYELQRLHGMGELIYARARERFRELPPVRTYAPVGPHKHLLAYLVRRLLENGANSSFVNRFLDDETPIADLTRDPAIKVIETSRRIALPPDLFAPERGNSRGYEIQEPAHLVALERGLEGFAAHTWEFGEVVVSNPAIPAQPVGSFSPTAEITLDGLLETGVAQQFHWNELGGSARAAILRRLADALENAGTELMALLIREAGKTLDDAIAEHREAIDFCRYYANQAERLFSQAVELPGPTGESNKLVLQGRGVYLCISPWNFPLAIFTGQITAALAAGNTVIAKPAEQTPLIAERVLQLAERAGVPPGVLQLAQGAGPNVAEPMVKDPRVSGVVFTGSTTTAKRIQACLAERAGAIVPLIAETGGQNAMIVDSTAMPEQVVDDCLRSAFGSAGQRCSALRVLYLQEDSAAPITKMLMGAMARLVVDDPWQIETDVGPIIDLVAKQALEAHIDACRDHVLYQTPFKQNAPGYFVAPTLIEIGSISELSKEHFGPVLHVARYTRDQLDTVLNDINATGYGLTLGIHSRNSRFAAHVFDNTRHGNVYVNRNMIGAVVGVQPFGGHGLSGTGPKAGGPQYLPRFAMERVHTENLTAIGGNAALLADEG
ncbi:MAG: bifunctional proline dehydrogenase/L-glutamate gamma-semialdehyde dehydrogenase PutA [Gammaproteobacteria bacterium]|nr:bifunctional proline dehydrogenase/L-glutamate gamma-semialdehyde dehydrogenase PutA [Gammaproteobacteria bacterium]